MSGENDDLEAFYGRPRALFGIPAADPVTQIPAEEQESAPYVEERNSLLTPPARVALQKLLARGVILSRTYPEDFMHLVGGKTAIDQIMSSMGLSMHVHFDYGMAVVMRSEDVDPSDALEDVEGDEDEEGGAVLVRTTRLNLLHSLVLMVMRMYYRERERAGDKRVIIEVENLKDRLRPYWPLLNAEARSDKRFNGAISKMQAHGILLGVRGKEDQREISPVIVLALDSEKLAVLVSEYSRLAGVQVKQEGKTDE